MEIEYLESAVMHKYDSRAKWVGEPEHTPITVLTVAFGAEVQTFYVHRVGQIIQNSIELYTSYTGKTIWINTSYIICAQDMTLVKVLKDVTDCAPRPSSEGGCNILTKYCLIDTDKEIRLED